MQQFDIDFERGLTEQFPDWWDCVKASVYGCGRPFKAIAADLDMSVSELSRKLNDNPADNVNFAGKRLPDLINATGDLRPVYWLIEHYCQDAETRKRQALSELNAALPKIRQALAMLGDD